MMDQDMARRYLTGALTGGPRPAAVGQKFSPSGDVLATPGNTMICHVDKRSDAFAALTDAQSELRAGPRAGAFAFLPPESFHMTIFEGVIDCSRTPGRWPSHMPPDAPVDAVTEEFATRLRGTSLAPRLQARPEGIFAGFSVSMTGRDKKAEALLRETRDRLQAATQLVRPDHAAYRFHITLAYLLRWLDPTEAEEVLELSNRVGKDLVARVPHIAFGPVEFCRFQTMHHFERLFLLD